MTRQDRGWLAEFAQVVREDRSVDVASAEFDAVWVEADRGELSGETELPDLAAVKQWYVFLRMSWKTSFESYPIPLL